VRRVCFVAGLVVGLVAGVFVPVLPNLVGANIDINVAVWLWLFFVPAFVVAGGFVGLGWEPG
jgi:hypothetical protein